MTDGYDDGRLVCGLDRLKIGLYYFPFGTKSVPYDQIKGLQPQSSHPMTRTRSSAPFASGRTSRRGTPVR